MPRGPRPTKKKSAPKPRPTTNGSRPKTKPHRGEDPFKKSAPAPATTDLGGFSTAVSNRLRYLMRYRDECNTKRAELFKTRDGLLAEIDTLGKAESKKRAGLDQQLGETFREIDRLRKTIAWCDSEAFNNIRKADEPGLFEDDETPKPPPSLFEHKPPREKKDASSVGGEEEQPEGGAGGDENETPEPAGEPAGAAS